MKLANDTVPVSETVLVIVFVAEEWRGKLVRKRGEKKVQGFLMYVGGGVGVLKSCQPPRQVVTRGGAFLTAPCV